MPDRHTESDTGYPLTDELKLQAWLARAEIKNPSVHKEVSALAQLRDQLRVQAHLGKLEAREELEKLEPTWLKVKGHLDHAAEEVGGELKELLKDIRKGYERLVKS